MNKLLFSERSWLDVDYDGKRISFAYPPVQGTHEENYKAIAADPEIVPAEGLEVSLLTQEAFTGNSSQWQDVRDRCITQNCVRIPRRLTWIPSKEELAGVFIERDLKGKGLSERMNIPDNIDGWRNQNGIYVRSDNEMVFVPKRKYKFGAHNRKTFSKDGLAVALLTEEGAEIFAKTAQDNRRIPYNFGVDITEISSPEQRVAVVVADRYRLLLYGYYLGDCRYGFSFGVAKNSKGNQG